MKKFVIHLSWVILATSGCGSSSDATKQSDAALPKDAATHSDAAAKPDADALKDATTPSDTGSVIDAAILSDAGSVIDATTPSDAGSLKDATDQTDAASKSDAAANPDSGSQSTSCDRECLVDFVTKYLNALIARDSSSLPVVTDIKFTENGDKLSLGEGLWKTASRLRPYRQNFVDVSQEQAGCFAILEEDGAPAMLALRLKVVNKKITEVETVVTRNGQASLFAPDSLTAPDPIFDQPLQTSERTSRERMVEIVNLYFDGIEAANASSVPFDPQCGRLENGVQTATSANIASQFAIFTYIDEVQRRVLIVDQERGLVWGIFLFMVSSQSRTTFVAELFKITNEHLRSINAFMVNQPYGKTWGW